MIFFTLLTFVKWFNENYFKMNADKCHLLVVNTEKSVTANINGENIVGNQSVKLLGVTIDNKLDFNAHVTNTCKKASLKLHALARISHLMNKNKLRNLMKAFIESQFAFCPLRLVYKDNKCSFQQLLDKDKSFSIHERNLQKLAIEMFKVRNNISPSFTKLIFPHSQNPYNLRNESYFQTDNVRSVHYGTETLSFRGPKTWTLIPEKSEIQLI